MLRHAMLDTFTGHLRGVFCEIPSGPALPDHQRGTNQRHDLFPEEGNGLSGYFFPHDVASFSGKAA
jgi:hypothetical protein